MLHTEGMDRVNGLHHITAIAGPAQENLDFYAGVLGMRLVKRSVNQDDPGTYHLFYADAEGHPGTDLTFFPWTHLAPPRIGHGLAVEVSLEVPAGSLDYWAARLEKYGTVFQSRETRFGDSVLPATDPHGLRIALVESGRSMRRPFTPWEDSPVPGERQVRGLYGARIWEREAAPSASFLTSVLGFERLGAESGWTRYGFGDVAGVVDVQETRRSTSRSLGRRQRPPSRVERARRGASARRARAGRSRRRPCHRGHRPLLVQVGVLQGTRRRPVRDRHRGSGVRHRRGPAAPRRVARAAALAGVAPAGHRACLCQR